MSAGRKALRWLERLLFTVATVSLGVRTPCR
jgi:hypothetical protein